MKRWFSALKAVMVLPGFLLLLPQPGSAIPAFARCYKLRCFACHTIPPVLKKDGYMFKRLGFHLPPALQKGDVAPHLSDLIQQEPMWTLGNNAAFAVADFDFAAQRNTQDGATPTSTSSFQVGTWNAYLSGWVPDTNFFYYSQINLIAGGDTNPSVAVGYFGYVGGTAGNSWYVQGGDMHVMGANGTTAANTESLLPAAPLMWEYTDPDNFVLDQHMVGLRAGYTWALPGYKQVLGASLSVSNGDHADGSTITGPDARNAKDLYVDLDWWYAPESGVSFLSYYGKRTRSKTAGPPTSSLFTPRSTEMGFLPTTWPSMTGSTFWEVLCTTTMGMESQVQALVLPALYHLFSLRHPGDDRDRPHVLLPALPAAGIPGHEGPPVCRFYGAFSTEHASLGSAWHGGPRLSAHVPGVLHRLVQKTAPVQLGGRRAVADARPLLHRVSFALGPT